VLTREAAFTDGWNGVMGIAGDGEVDFDRAVGMLAFDDGGDGEVVDPRTDTGRDMGAEIGAGVTATPGTVDDGDRGGGVLNSTGRTFGFA